MILALAMVKTNLNDQFNGSNGDGKDQYDVPSTEFKYKIIDHQMKINYAKLFKILKLKVQRLEGDVVKATYTYFIKQIFAAGVNMNNGTPIETKKFVEVMKNGVPEYQPLPEVCFVPEFKPIKENSCKGYFKATVEKVKGTTELVANAALEKPGLEILVKNLKKENFEKLTQMKCNIDMTGNTVFDLDGYLKKHGISLDFVNNPQALTEWLKNNKRENDPAKYDIAVCTSLVLVMNKVNETGECLVKKVFKKFSLRILCSIKALNSSESAMEAMEKAFKDAGLSGDFAKHNAKIAGMASDFTKHMKDHDSKLGVAKKDYSLDTKQ